MKIKIADATATQLAGYAQTHLGLTDVTFRMGKDRILAQMQATGFTADEIQIGDDAPDGGQHVVREPVVVQPARAGASRRMVRLIISEVDTPGSSEGREPVPVSVNGSLMYVPRGKEVEIPWEYYHALANAKWRLYDTAPDEFSPLGDSREVPRFPMTVLHMDPETAKAA